MKEKSLAEHLKNKRKELGVSQEELAEASGVPLETVKKIEHGLGCSFGEFGTLLRFLNIGE